MRPRTVAGENPVDPVVFVDNDRISNDKTFSDED